MKIERPRICKSCGYFHIVHIWQLEGGEGRSICICLIVCVCICVSVFVFVYVLVYLYLCYCICIVPPRQLGGGKRILRTFSSAAHLQPVRWSGCWSAAVYFCSFSMPQINKIENNKSTFATGSLVVAEVMEGSDDGNMCILSLSKASVCLAPSGTRDSNVDNVILGMHTVRGANFSTPGPQHRN